MNAEITHQNHSQELIKLSKEQFRKYISNLEPRESYPVDTIMDEKMVDEKDPTSWKYHPSGWKVRGEVHHDYFVWVDGFEAEHPVFGRVIGYVCNQDIHASSIEAADHFFSENQIYAIDFSDK